MNLLLGPQDPSPSFGDAVVAYLTEPSADTFVALRGLVAASPTYDPMVNPDAVARPFLDANDPQGAIDALEALMPGAFLVPSAHGLLALAHERLGDADGVQRHRTLARAAVAGVLNAGKGTEESPWPALTVAEQYDVLGVLGKESTRVSLIARDGSPCDVHELADGSAAWFELLWHRGAEDAE